MAEVALRFGCAKQSKNLERYLMVRDLVVYLSDYNFSEKEKKTNSDSGLFWI